MTALAVALAGGATAAFAAALGVPMLPARRRVHTAHLSVTGSSVSSPRWRATPPGEVVGRVLRPAPSAAPVADMVALLDAVARSLQSGGGIHDALRSALPFAGVHARGLGGVLASVASGRSLADGLMAWQRHRPTPEVALATAVLGFGLHTGGSLARAVDGAAATLRERLALAGEVRVLATQARASAVVVGGAPVGFTVLVVLTDPRVGTVLFGTPIGWGCLTVGFALEGACVWWMRRLVARTSKQ